MWICLRVTRSFGQLVHLSAVPLGLPSMVQVSVFCTRWRKDRKSGPLSSLLLWACMVKREIAILLCDLICNEIWLPFLCFIMALCLSWEFWANLRTAKTTFSFLLSGTCFLGHFICGLGDVNWLYLAILFFLFLMYTVSHAVLLQLFMSQIMQ